MPDHTPDESLQGPTARVAAFLDAGATGVIAYAEDPILVSDGKILELCAEDVATLLNAVRERGLPS